MYEDMEVLRSDRMHASTMWQARTTPGETQIIGADIQRAARRSAAEHEAAAVEGAAAPAHPHAHADPTRTRTRFPQEGAG